jgi:UDPglucose--hexose-1-phosphate uridylyltransferase
MPQLRKDPIFNRWVIISTERARRPQDFVFEKRGEAKGGFCPFCEGNEAKTPPEIISFRKSGTKANEPGWWLRVIPNKYPALAIEGDLSRKGIGMFDQMNGVGAHEVIVETTRHIIDIAELSESEIAEVILSYQMRSLDLKKDPRFRYILIFKNCGEGAGASLEHSHSQIIATPVTPKRVREELLGAAQHYQLKERCVFCDIIEQEIDSGKRLIQESRDFLVISPFAACFPFETWIVPKRHHPDFDQMTEGERKDLAATLKKTLYRINRALDKPPYNYLIHTAPNRVPRSGYWQTIDKDYHWHLEIVPRVTGIAGFEWGTGFYINPTPPEDAATYLRSIE